MQTTLPGNARLFRRGRATPVERSGQRQRHTVTAGALLFGHADRRPANRLAGLRAAGCLAPKDAAHLLRRVGTSAPRPVVSGEAGRVQRCRLDPPSVTTYPPPPSLTFAHLRSPSLTFAHLRSPSLTFAHLRSPSLTFAHLRSPRRTPRSCCLKMDETEMAITFFPCLSYSLQEHTLHSSLDRNYLRLDTGECQSLVVVLLR